MHSYLRPIGFSRYINKVRVNSILKKVMDDPDYKTELMITNEETVFEFRKNFCTNMGITVHGIVNEKQEYEIEYYFPYYIGTNIIVAEDLAMEKNVSCSSYYGATEDYRVGVSLIFYVINSLGYINNCIQGIGMQRFTPVAYSALALSGKILLPVKKTKEDIQRNKSALSNRNKLISAAKRGDESAMESLTVSELDTYTKISGRILKEDVFSIVDSSFMPYGVSCDRYSIIGTIIRMEKDTNILTNEEIYKLTIECNELRISLAINTSDLMGVPELGRRFKGIIWLQGMVGF